jgi:hypothetical protein
MLPEARLSCGDWKTDQADKQTRTPASRMIPARRKVKFRFEWRLIGFIFMTDQEWIVYMPFWPDYNTDLGGYTPKFSGDCGLEQVEYFSKELGQCWRFSSQDGVCGFSLTCWRQGEILSL